LPGLVTGVPEQPVLGLGKVDASAKDGDAHVLWTLLLGG
jgi:hypothetical protein